jgi:hypothetical protein
VDETELLEGKIVQLAISNDDPDSKEDSVASAGMYGHHSNGQAKQNNGQDSNHSPRSKQGKQHGFFGAESILGFPSALSSPALTGFANVKSNPSSNGSTRATNSPTLPISSVGVQPGTGNMSLSSSLARNGKKEGSSKSPTSPPQAGGLFVNKNFDPEAECQKCKSTGTVYNKDLVRYCWKCCPCVYCGQGYAVCQAGVCATCYSPLLGERLR